MTYRRPNRTIPPSVVGIVRALDGALIPADPGNTDWQAYQAWLEAGNTPADPPTPPAPEPGVKPGG